MRVHPGFTRTAMMYVIRMITKALLPSALLVASNAGEFAEARSYSVLYAFSNSTDGMYPGGDVNFDSSGNIYSVTSEGGANSCDCGTVFKVAPDGTETVLLSFDRTNGAFPLYAPLIAKDGTLYGTTFEGGADQAGTIFRIAADGKEKVLYSFCKLAGCADGADPYSQLIIDKKGNLFGVTQAGGTNDNGTIFEFTTTGKLHTLYLFDYNTSGAQPGSALVRDAAGNLYGTAPLGGAYDEGTIFKLSPKGKETTLYSFTGVGGDGGGPGGIIMDSAGNLFGTTWGGGLNGFGTIFEFSASGTETVLYSFQNEADGSEPMSPLVRDESGNLYGTTGAGGGSGGGALFKLSPTGRLSVLHTFAFSDGEDPGALLFHKGAFYSTAFRGGNGDCGNGSGCGTVFKFVK